MQFFYVPPRTGNLIQDFASTRKAIFEKNGVKKRMLKVNMGALLHNVSSHLPRPLGSGTLLVRVRTNVIEVHGPWSRLTKLKLLTKGTIGICSIFWLKYNFYESLDQENWTFFKTLKLRNFFTFKIHF